MKIWLIKNGAAMERRCFYVHNILSISETPSEKLPAILVIYKGGDENVKNIGM